MALNFRPKYDKIVELLLYLAHKKPGADKYQAVKFFYLADREHLIRYGRPITYERYVALKYGPVASITKDLLEENRFTMRDARVATLPFRIKKIPRPGYSDLVAIEAPTRPVDFDVFSKSDIEVFDEVLAKFGNCNFDQLYKLTHSHNAYKKAWDGRGAAKFANMKYEEMIEPVTRRQEIVEDIGPVSNKM